MLVGDKGVRSEVHKPEVGTTTSSPLL